MAVVLVTDAELGSAISVIRSLGRRGDRVIAASSVPGAPGFRSRFVRGRLRHTPAATDPSGFVDRILAAVERWKVELVIPVSDEHVIPLVAARERLATMGARLAAAEDVALEATRDKLRTVQLAAELGIPAPETEVVSTLAAGLDAGARLGWPVVVKPRFSRAVQADGGTVALEVTYANAADELAERLVPRLALGDVLVQRFHAGEGHGVELLLDAGRPVAAFQHRRLREVPVTGGASAYRESVALDPQLLRHASALMGALDWTGLAMIEFRVGASGPVLLEVNGRIWGSMPLAVKSGMDFPARLAALLLAETPPTTVDGYRPGVRSHHLRLELVWIASVLRGRRRYPYLPFPPRRAAIGALASLLRPSGEHDVLSLDDPLPGIADGLRAIGHVLGKAGGG
jgi:predicted ATP-grasp superfamily ATP-dependent carboligase